MASNFTEIDHTKKRRFLNAYAAVGTLRGAETCGVSRQSHYQWLKDDPEYVAAFAEAKLMAGDMLEDVAIERAKKKSDLLLIFLLKGFFPEKYKERRELSGALDIKSYSGVDVDAV